MNIVCRCSCLMWCRRLHEMKELIFTSLHLSIIKAVSMNLVMYFLYLFLCMWQFVDSYSAFCVLALWNLMSLTFRHWINITSFCMLKLLCTGCAPARLTILANIIAKIDTNTSCRKYRRYPYFCKNYRRYCLLLRSEPKTSFLGISNG